MISKRRLLPDFGGMEYVCRKNLGLAFGPIINFKLLHKQPKSYQKYYQSYE